MKIKPFFSRAIPLRSAALWLLASVVWCVFLWRALYVFAPGSPNVDFNSDSAIPVLMSVDERPVSPFNLYYYREDRWGAWGLLVARFIRYLTGLQWTPERLFVLHGSWIFSGSLVLAALAKRDAVLVVLSYLCVLCLHTETRFILFRMSQTYAWQLTGVLLAWLGLRRVFESFIEGAATTKRARAGWLLLTALATFVAVASSTVSAPFISTFLGLEVLRGRWKRSASGASRRLLAPGLLGALAVVAAVGAEQLQKRIVREYDIRHFGSSYATQIEIDWDYLAVNLEIAWQNILKLSWWPIYFVPAVGCVGFLSALFYARVRKHRELTERLEAVLADDSAILVLGGYLVAIVNFVVVVCISHVRVNLYDDRYLTPTNLFAPISGLLSLLLFAKFFAPSAPVLRRAENVFGGVLLAGLTIAFPARGSDARYLEHKKTALALARLAPDGILMGGYWDTYFFSALQPERALMSLPFEGDTNRMPWSVDRLKTADSALVAYPRNSEQAASPPKKLWQYGVTLALSNPRLYEDSEYVFAQYRKTSERPPRGRRRHAEPAPTDASPPVASAAAPLQSYDASHFQLAPCARVGANNVIDAENCPSGFVVYGPYVAVPGGSNVEFSFELESTRPVQLSTDMASGAGKTMHAAVLEQPVRARTPHRSRQILRIFEPVEAFEGRIAVNAEGRSSFKIRGLSLTVRQVPKNSF